MYLEIFGKLIEIAGKSLESPEGEEWNKKRRDKTNQDLFAALEMQEGNRKDAAYAQALFPPIHGKMTLQIETATYSNLQYPGVNVPLYM